MCVSVSSTVACVGLLASTPSVNRTVWTVARKVCSFFVTAAAILARDNCRVCVARVNVFLLFSVTPLPLRPARYVRVGVHSIHVCRLVLSPVCYGGCIVFSCLTFCLLCTALATLRTLPTVPSVPACLPLYCAGCQLSTSPQCASWFARHRTISAKLCKRNRCQRKLAECMRAFLPA